jgi:Domain of unknown function (DUF1840)
MIYKFKSKASGDVIMLGPNGDQMLRILGREPAPKGIIEVGHMAAAVAALREAVRQDAMSSEEDEADGKGVSLHQRLWPVIELLERSQAAGEPVVWGV